MGDPRHHHQCPPAPAASNLAICLLYADQNCAKYCYACVDITMTISYEQALNAETGLLVSILTPQGGEAGNLVSINTTSLKVMSAPQLCAEYDACPWTLAWAL